MREKWKIKLLMLLSSAKPNDLGLKRFSESLLEDIQRWNSWER